VEGGPVLILLARLTRLDESILSPTIGILKRCLGADVLVSLEVMQPPMVFYNWERMQYRSDYILEWLAEISKDMRGDILVALGDIDAYVPGLNFVFGQASPGAGVAAVYLRRLRPSFYGYREDLGLLAERVSKEALHEVGHILGLGHCSDKRCVMSFSNSIDEVDAKKPAFCPRCASALEDRGMRVGCRLQGYDG
jgi:archaemetzincin